MAVRAAIDVGSNSVKLLVADIKADGGYEVLYDTSRVTGLGQGLGDSGQLDADAAERTLDCLRDFAQQARERGAESIRAAGTSALRRADDAAQFIARVEHKLGFEIEVVSGTEEARLARTVALAELPAGPANVVLFDVGGGSTELTLIRGEEVEAVCSLQLGARRCTEDAGVSHPVIPPMLERLAAMLATALNNMPPEVRSSAAGEVRLAGLGGTATTMVWMLQGARGEAAGDPHGECVTLADGYGLLDRLGVLTVGGMRVVPNLDPARADVIFAGIAIITALMEHYGAGEFTLVDRGLRFGLLLA